MLYLGWQALKIKAVAGASVEEAASLYSVFVRATLNSLLNPKALLFFMVFLPQFVSVQNGNVPLQLMLLGAVLSVVALLFHMLLAMCSSRLRYLRGARSGQNRMGRYLVATVMFGLSARLVLLSRS